MNVPDAVGVPLIVITLPDQEAETPVGNPVAEPIPVAPVVAIVIVGERVVPIQIVGLKDATPAVFAGVTEIVPVALTLPHPPVNGIV